MTLIRYPRIFDYFDSLFDLEKSFFEPIRHNKSFSTKCIEDKKEKRYYEDGMLHKMTGPAVIKEDGTEEYWIEGKHLTKEEYDNYIKKIEENKKTRYFLDLTQKEKEEIEKILNRKIE